MKKIIIASTLALMLVLPLTTVAKVNHHATKATTTMPVNGQVDINKANAKTLTKVKGIGAKRAQAIIDYRQQHGAFKSIEELAKIKGISGKMVEKIHSQLKLS